MNVIISIAAFIVAIGVLVTVHEFGHFIVARFLGVKVLRFSVGFGKPLWRWQRNPGSTEYVIAWIPLGGYNKFLDEREGEVSESEKHLAFNRQPLAKRFPIVLAGPVFNLLFAVLAYWVIFVVGVPGIRPIVGEIRAGSPAALAGFQPQDEIVAVNGHATPTWDTALVRLFEGVMQGQPLAVTVRTEQNVTQQLRVHAGDTRALTEPGKLIPGLGLSQWQPQAAPVIEQVTEDGSARQAGLKAGDVILKVGSTVLTGPGQFVQILQAAPNQTLDLLVQRGSQQLNLPLHVGVQNSAGKAVGHIGAALGYPDWVRQRLAAEQRYNPAAAVGQALVRTGSLAWLTLDASWNMVIGKVSLRNLSGPIDIAQYAGYTAESGLLPFLAFLAIVSISLGVLNLLPIPVLDGGHLLYYVMEAIKGSPLSAQAEMTGQRIGLTLIVLLLGFAVYNDLMRLFG